MTPQRYERLRELFLSVCDLPAQQQAAALDEHCADDPSMKTDILALLAMDAKEKGLLESPTLTENIQRQLTEALATQTETPTPKTIGDYRIVRKLGDGGMGTVFEAQQDHPRRTVALKIIRFGLASEKMLKRFEHEAHVLGLLQHPGIAQIYEAGTADTGSGPQPYFAMELVPGEPLSSYAKQRALGTRQCLELVSKLCDAIQHAHTKGVVHRDLKPGNILVTEDGQPKILDFGVARATDSDIQTTTLQTDIGQLIGTIPYMSPEQAGGNPDEIDTRSDVYSLGVLLYELLTNRLPHELKEKMIHEAVRVIREEEPTRLSSINPQLRGDVETIVAKALEKDKDRRYQTARELAADIRRYLDDEPIEARPASAIYQFRKFTKRNKALVGGVAAAFVMLALGVSGTSFGLMQALQQKTLAQELLFEADKARTIAHSEANKSSAIIELLREVIIAASPGELRGKDITVRELLDTMSASLGERYKDSPEVKIAVHGTIARTYLDLGEFDAAERNAKSHLDLCRTLYGKNHLETFNAMLTLGNTYLGSARLAKADSLFQQTESGLMEQFGPNHPVTMEVKRATAALQTKRGNNTEARRILEELIDRQSRVLGENVPATLTSMHRLGSTLVALGLVHEAADMFEATIAKTRLVLGRAHPHTIQLIADLGGLRNQLGEYDAAAVLHEEAIARGEEVYTTDHPVLLFIKHNYAVFLSDRGRTAEAEELFWEVLSSRRRSLGLEHPQTLRTASSLALVLQNGGKYEESKQLLQQNRAVALRVLGQAHDVTLILTTALARLYDQLGQYGEAEQLYELVLRERMEALGEAHPDSMTVMNLLGGLLWEQGKLDRAHKTLERVRRLRADLYGPEHPSTLTTMNNIGLVLNAKEQYQEAESVFQKVLETNRRILGDSHPQTLTSKHNLGLAYYGQERFDDAAAAWKDVARDRRALLGSDHPAVLSSLGNLAVAFEHLDKMDEAARLHEEVLELRRQRLGEKHPKYLDTLANVASFRMKQGLFEDAARLYQQASTVGSDVMGSDHWRPWQWRRAYGDCLVQLRKFTEAEIEITESYAQLRTLLGADHRRTHTAVKSAIALYEAWGKPEKTAEYRALLEEAEKEPQDNNADDTGAEEPDEAGNDDGGANEETPGGGADLETRSSASPPETSTPALATVE